VLCAVGPCCGAPRAPRTSEQVRPPCLSAFQAVRRSSREHLRLNYRGLEGLLKGYNLAYNARHQRVLDGRSPDEVVSERLKARPELTNPTYRPPDPCSLTKTKIAAQLKVFSAKEVSQPDN